MKRLADIDELPAGLRFVLVIGMFDGVHRGHQRVLRVLVATAAEHDAEPVVLTFEPHPAAVLRGNPPPLLCDPAEKLSLMGRLGVRTVIVQRFDRAFAEQPPDDFLASVCRRRTMVALVMTEESAFGRDRAGGLPAIRRLADPLGFRIVEVPRVAVDGAPLSSTRLRNLITGGRLAEAARLLGRRYAVTGRVVAGDRRGRALGYPTANLAFAEPVALPPDGIYAVRASWSGDDPLDPSRTADGVASLGVRPTFGGGERRLEAYLFDIDEDIYDEQLRVEFVRRLRGEQIFASVEKLVDQMNRDTARARQVLSAIR